MRRPTLCLLAITVVLNVPLSACATPTPLPQPVQTPGAVPPPVSQSVSDSAPAALELDDGFTVDIPADALYADDTLTISVAEDVSRAPDSDFAIPGPVYDVELANADLFRQPVRITIPYDPSLLPEGRSEDEIIAVYWCEDEAVPVYGEVEIDQTANTVTVLALHNTLWSWGYRVRDDITGRTRHCFTALAEQPETIAEARELKERRWQEWMDTLDMLLAQVERVEERLEPLKSGVMITESLLKKSAAYLIPWDKMAAFFAAHGAAPGAVALIGAGGSVIGLVGNVAGTTYLVRLNEEWYQASELAHSATLAQARYHEANCILYALEYPGASSSQYGCGQQLDQYVEGLGVDQCEDWDFDPEFSSVSEAMAWPLVSMQPTPTPIPPSPTPVPPTPIPPTPTAIPPTPAPACPPIEAPSGVYIEIAPESLLRDQDGSLTRDVYENPTLTIVGRTAVPGQCVNIYSSCSGHPEGVVQLVGTVDSGVDCQFRTAVNVRCMRQRDCPFCNYLTMYGGPCDWSPPIFGQQGACLGFGASGPSADGSDVGGWGCHTTRTCHEYAWSRGYCWPEGNVVGGWDMWQE